MTFGQAIRASYRQIQLSWNQLADRAFRNAAPARQDDVARGEFISAFICETDLTLPAASRARQPRH